MDVSVITSNFKFLILQGLIGIGPFIGGTPRLAIPAILLGFVLGIFVGLARLAQAPWSRLPATMDVEVFPGGPPGIGIFLIWFLIPPPLRLPIPQDGLGRTPLRVLQG